jgi:hypothetical protein
VVTLLGAIKSLAKIGGNKNNSREIMRGNPVDDFIL